MKKILFLIRKDTIYFSVYEKPINEVDVNNTNIIDTKNLKFTDDYILENIDLLASFLNLLVIKQNVKTAVIKNNDIAEPILILLKRINKIEEIYFKEDKEINYTISSLLLENNNLKIINCYTIPEIMYERFKSKVITRSQIKNESPFMKYNKIFTYSDLRNKEKIIIDSYLTENDVDDIIYFFKSNEKLKKIILKGYKKQNLLAFLKMLKDNNHKNINIDIMEDEKTTNDIINDVPIFVKLNKKYNVNIKIKYSKEYKEKNCVKEINLYTLKVIILIIILLLLLAIYIFSQQEKLANENIKENIKDINETIIEVNKETDSTSEETDPYYNDFNSVYKKLLEKNNDTVGFLQINNTNINYPIVQAYDNEYYLKHSFDKSKNIAGWIFVDYRNNMDQLNKNTIIYGHNMKNETMFGSLMNILKEEWLNDESNYIIKLNVKGRIYYCKIFSIYVTKKTSDYLKVDFNEEEFLNYINVAKEKSVKDFEVKVTENDNILTLSTCYNNDRLVVHAKLLNN